MTAATTDPATDFASAWERWHRARVERLRDPFGFLSLTALHWLTDSPERIDGLPGTWWVTDGKVFVTARPGDRLDHDGTRVAGVHIVVPAEGAPGITLRHEDRVLEIIRRTGRYAVRVHDPASPALVTFHDVPAYAPDERWVVTGRFTAAAEPRTVTTGAVVDGLEHHHTAAGTVEFTLGGVTEQLVVFRADGELRVLFTDATSGVTTHPGARALSLPEPGPEGAVELDFTRAVNLPCAFTDFATCPIAPAENRLRVAIEAGERDPRRERVA